MWRNINLRFDELTDYDLIVAKLKKGSNWNNTGLVLAYYSKGKIYDSWAIDDKELDASQWEITDECEEYLNLIKNHNVLRGMYN